MPEHILPESTNSTARPLPVEPTEAMVKAFVDLALHGDVLSHGGWPGYAREQWRVMVAAAPPTLSFQERVQPWLMACFGERIAGDREERNHRFLEEALELVQACGCTASEAHQLVDYVFDRKIGEQRQEVGGVMVTLAALCLANALDMHDAGEVELARIWTKVEGIRAKQAAKPKHSPLPQANAIADVAAERARQVQALGWTPEHDDRHDQDLALPRAAACYALAGIGDSAPFWIARAGATEWVWPQQWQWKPKNRRADLVRAGALIVAEIERLDRAVAP
jgi:hypothetical protein